MFYFSSCEIFVLYIFRMWNALWYFVLYFSACRTRTGVLFSIFPSVERALVFCVIFFRVWNALWYFVLYFSAFGTRSGILYHIFPRLERALVFYVLFFRVWNTHWYFMLYFPLCKRSGISCCIFCVIFSRGVLKAFHSL